MKPEQDAFGQGERVIEIVERDDGYIGATGGPAGYFSPAEEWSSNKTAVFPLIHGRVLDVGCGPGRVALYCQEQGLEAVAIDLSPLAIKTARLRGVKDTRVLSITQASRKVLGVFNTIVMFGPWFEYLMVSPEEMAEIVAGTGWHVEQIVWREDGVDYTAVLQK